MDWVVRLRKKRASELSRGILGSWMADERLGFSIPSGLPKSGAGDTARNQRSLIQRREAVHSSRKTWWIVLVPDYHRTASEGSSSWLITIRRPRVSNQPNQQVGLYYVCLDSLVFMLFSCSLAFLLVGRFGSSWGCLDILIKR